MELLGTVYNGQIQLDHPANLPKGTRIVSLPADEYEADFGELGDLAGSNTRIRWLRTTRSKKPS